MLRGAARALLGASNPNEAFWARGYKRWTLSSLDLLRHTANLDFRIEVGKDFGTTTRQNLEVPLGPPGREGIVVFRRIRAEACWRVGMGELVDIGRNSSFQNAQHPREAANLEQAILLQKALTELALLALREAEISAFLDKIVVRVREVLGCEFSEVLELVGEEDMLLLRAGKGWKEGKVGKATVGTGLDSQAGYTLISRRPVLVEDLGEESRFDGAPLLHEHGVVSGVTVKIYSQGRLFGVLGAHSSSRRRFSEKEADFLQSVAEIVGLATERDLAREGDRFALAEEKRRASAAEERFTFLTEASTVLSSASSRASALAAAARLAVPAIADWCFVDLLEEHDGDSQGHVRRLVVAGKLEDAESKELASDLRYRYYAHDPHTPHGTPKVLRTGKHELLEEVTDEHLRAIARDGEHLQRMRRMNPTSYICVPLQVQRRLIGAVGFVSAESGRRYGPEDLAVAEGLVRCAALVVGDTLEGLAEPEKSRELSDLAERAGEEGKIVSSPVPASRPVLTRRQEEILRLLDRGMTAAHIKDELRLSEHTVRTHLKAIRRALQACSQLEALRKARDLGLL